MIVRTPGKGGGITKFAHKYIVQEIQAGHNIIAVFEKGKLQESLVCA